ncbi:MAG: hypothetical protein NZ561_09435, partial [Phycisphaerae bacterium]|nr:hypothetical protein [Phycisphaerae bacterium]
LTLTFDSSSAQQLPARISDTAWKSLVPLVFPELEKFWTARLAIYAKGEPVECVAETIPVRFVSWPRTWSALSEQQQASAVQATYNQLSLAFEHASASSGVAREAYLRVMQFSADGLATIATMEPGSEALSAAARTVRSLQPGGPPEAAQQAMNDLRATIRRVPKFQKLVEAPRRVAAGPG